MSLPSGRSVMRTIRLNWPVVTILAAGILASLWAAQIAWQPLVIVVAGLAVTGTLARMIALKRRESSFDEIPTSDLTEMRASERVVREERDFVDALLDSLPGYFVLIDQAGHLVRWNESLRFLNGLTDAQLLGANPFAHVLEDDRAKTLNKVHETLVNGRGELEFRINSQNGVRDIRWQARRIMVDGKPHALAIGVDVTDVHASEALRRAGEQRYRDIFEAATDGILVQDVATNRFIDANPRILELLGYTREELLALDAARVSAATPEEVRGRRALMRSDKSSGSTPFEWLFLAKDGREIWCDVSSRHIANFDGRSVILTMIRDITERRQAREAIAYRDRILHAVTLSTAELVRASSLPNSMATLLKSVGEELAIDRLMVIQRAGVEHTRSGAAIAFGWQREGVVQVDLSEFEDRPNKTFWPELAAWFAPLALRQPVVTYAATATGIVREILEQANTLSNILMPITVSGAYWGHFAVDDTHTVREWNATELDALQTLADVVGSLIERNQASEIIERMATHDLLTDLPNRRFFIDALNAAIGRSKRSGRRLAVLYLDLDRFKDINDTLGHPAGDRLLQVVATRLGMNVREIDTVARFGGDEFAAIQIDIREPADAAVLAEKFVKVLAEPFDIDGNEIQSATSIGIAVYGEDSADAEALLAHADIALYRAKADGRGTYRFYTESMDDDVRERVTMEKELRDALALEQLFLVYQPQIDLTNGNIVGIEARVRWMHPRLGILRPARFILLAERSGLIVSLKTWIFREACRQTKCWLEAGIAPPAVGVHVSALQFKAPRNLEQIVASILDESQVPAAQIEIELTEDALMEASQNHSDVLLRMRASGLGLAIDEFGSGYSSLDQLRRFHVGRIKIARSLVAELGPLPNGAPIVRAAIALARELGITAIAGGVETAAQFDLLKSWGCSEGQGSYFSAPLSATDASTFLRAGTIRPHSQRPAVAPSMVR